jgi:hypothetical protein
MKQLTKEQVKAIVEWLDKHTDSDKQFPLGDMFLTDFPPSCCDSCADGETCESDRPKAVLIYDGMEVTNVTIGE